MSSARLFLPLLSLLTVTQVASFAAERENGSDRALPAGALARLCEQRFRHAGAVAELALSPDGKLLATIEQAPTIMEASADGRFSTTNNWLRTIRLWNAHTGRLLHTIQMGLASPIHLAFSPDGRKLATEVWERRDVKYRIFEVSAGNKLLHKEDIAGLDSIVRFSRNGKGLIVRDAAGTIHLVDVNTGKKVRKWDLLERKASISDAGFSFLPTLLLSPDERLLAYRTAEMKPVKGKPNGFAPAGNRIKMYEVATGKLLFTTKLFKYLSGIAFSPDGRRLAIGGEAILVLDTADGKQLHEFPAERDPVLRFSIPRPRPFFSPDGQTLCTLAQVEFWDQNSGRRTIERAKFWDLKTGRKKGRFVFGESTDAASGVDFLRDSGFRLAWSPDGKTVWLGQEHFVRVWDVEAAKEKETAAGHRRPVTHLSFSDEGKRLTSACDEAICEWDVPRRRFVRRIDARDAADGRLLAFSPTLRSGVFRNAKGAYELRDLQSGKIVRRIEEKSSIRGNYNPFAFAGPYLLNLATSEWKKGTTFWRYDGKTGKRAESISGMMEVRQMEHPPCTPDGRMFATCSPDGYLILLYGTSGQVRRRFCERSLLPKSDSDVPSCELVFSADGQYLASVFGEDRAVPEAELRRNAIQVWDTANGLEVGLVAVAPKPAQRFAVRTLALSPDHRRIAFAAYGEAAVRIWDINAESELACLRGHEGLVTALAFSSDGKLLASGSEDAAILLWDRSNPSSHGKTPPSSLSEKEWERQWQILAERDAVRAEAAMRILIDHAEQSVPLLEQRVKPIATLADETVRQWIKDLDSSEFAARQKARKSLNRFGELTADAMRRALRERPSLEARRSLTALLEDCGRAASCPERLQQWRALEVLERIGSVPAQSLLDKLANGENAARFTREARECLRRLRRQTSSQR